jgi:hypothetical protein
MESTTASINRRRAVHKGAVLSATCGFLLMVGCLPAKADTRELLAWGHKKDKTQSTSTSTQSTSTQTAAPANSTGQPSATYTGSVSGFGTAGAPAPNLLNAGPPPLPGKSTVGATSAPGAGMPIPGAPPVVQTPPVLTAPTSLVDLNSARFGKLTIDLQNGQFHDTSIDRGTATVTEMDFRQGGLKSLSIDVLGGHFQQFIFDEMTINTAGDLHFDPRVLLQDKVLQFATPAKADVMVTVSQDSLNKFLADPNTLQNLSVTVSKRLGGLASLFGASVANLGVKLNEAHVVLNKGNKIVIGITADLAMAGVGVPLSLEVDAQLGVKDGWVAVSDTHLMTNGQEISPQLSEMLVAKINSLASWGHRSDDIQFDFTDIKVVPGKQFTVKGTALIKRLRLERAKDDPTEHPISGTGGVPTIAVPVAPAPVNPGAGIPAPNQIPQNH